MALNGRFCAEKPLRNSLTPQVSQHKQAVIGVNYALQLLYMHDHIYTRDP